jgi:exonuclease SbcD
MNTLEPQLTSKCAGAYRILHTADWHLGKQLMDQERHTDHQRFLDYFLSAVTEHAVDAVIISGDIFDGVNPPAKSEELYYTTLATLHSLGVAAVIISGNHDSPTMLRSASTIIGKLGHQIITDVPETGIPHIVMLPSPTAPRVAIAAIPYMREGDLRKVELDEDINVTRERVRTGWRCGRPCGPASGHRGAVPRCCSWARRARRGGAIPARGV